MDEQRETRASYERAELVREKKVWKRHVSGLAAEANGTAFILRKGMNNVAVACPCRDGLEKATRRSRSTRSASRLTGRG